MPTVEAVMACKAASGSLTPPEAQEAERRANVGERQTAVV